MPCKIRVDCPFIKSDVDIVEFILKFTDVPENCLIVREHNPKEHIHVYLENNITVKTLRKNLNEVLTDTSNKGQRSVSDNHTDWKGYKAYLLKYPNTDILYIGDDLNEEELRDYYHEVTKDTQKGKKYSEITKIEKVLPETSTFKDTINAVIEYYISEKKIMNKAHMAQIAQTIYYTRRPQDRLTLIQGIALEADMGYILEEELEKEKVKKIIKDGNVEFLTNRQKKFVIHDDPE